MHRSKIFFVLGPFFLLATLTAAGPAPVGQPVILQGPVGPDIVPGLPYGAFPPGLEPRLGSEPPSSASDVAPRSAPCGAEHPACKCWRCASKSHVEIRSASTLRLA